MKRFRSKLSSAIGILTSLMALTAAAAAQDGVDIDAAANDAFDGLFETGGEFEQGDAPPLYTDAMLKNGAPAEYNTLYMDIRVDQENLDEVLGDLGIADDELASEAFIGVMIRHEVKHHGVYKYDPGDSEEERLCKHLANFIDDHAETCSRLSDANADTAALDSVYRACTAQANDPSECSTELAAVNAGNSKISGLCASLRFIEEQIEDLVVDDLTCTPYDVSDWQGPYTFYPAPVNFGPVGPCGNCYPY